MNWGTRVKLEELGKEAFTGVTTAQVPENLSSLAPYCVINIFNCDLLSTWIV